MNLNGLTLKAKPIDPALLITGENNKEEQAVDTHKEQSVKQNSKNAELNAILWAISPDCSYNEWFRIASAFKHEGGSYADFEEWSMQSDKFDEAVCERTWNSVGSAEKVPITKGTLLYYSKENTPIAETHINSTPTSVH